MGGIRPQVNLYEQNKYVYACEIMAFSLERRRNLQEPFGKDKLIFALYKKLHGVVTKSAT